MPFSRPSGVRLARAVVEQRKNYALYDNKASMGSEAAEGLRLLAQRLAAIGYEIDKSRGDYPGKTL